MIALRCKLNVIEEFVNTFAILDELLLLRDIDVEDGDVVPLSTSGWDADNRAVWRPVGVRTSRAVLKDLYQRVPGPLPSMYEELILSYQWAEVDLGRLTLLANLVPTPQTLANAISHDRVLFRVLSDGGFAQFGRGHDYDYDPVCCDISRRDSEGDAGRQIRSRRDPDQGTPCRGEGISAELP
jgi:hypothetical protein